MKNRLTYVILMSSAYTYCLTRSNNIIASEFIYHFHFLFVLYVHMPHPLQAGKPYRRLQVPKICEGASRESRSLYGRATAQWDWLPLELGGMRNRRAHRVHSRRSSVGCCCSCGVLVSGNEYFATRARARRPLISLSLSP